MSDMTQGDIDKFVEQYAKAKDITAAEAKRRIMGTGISRLKALSNYAGNTGGTAKKASKKAASKKDKATAPKAAKKAAKKSAAKKAPAKAKKAKATAAAPAVSEGEEG